LSLLVVLLRLPSLEHPFDNDSAANAYHARLILRGEPLYSTHHPAHHMPAIYYTYALAFFLFGDNLWAVKFLLMLWTIVTVYLLYRLGALLIGWLTGMLAAAFYAILSSHVWMWGNSAQIELFANLPRIAAFLVLLNLIASHPLGTPGAATWKFIFVGLLGAAAFLFKAIYLSPLALAGFILLLEFWQKRSTAGAWSVTLLRGGWIGLGFAIGLAIVVAYFGLSGLWPRLLLIFTLGQGYTDTSTVGWPYALFYPLVGLAYNNVALLIFSLVGLIIILTNKTQRTPALLYVAVWYILSFIEAGSLVRVFRFYYYLLIVPPLALLAAWFLLKVYRDARRTVRPLKPWQAPLVLSVLLTITLAISVAQNFNFYAHYFRYKLGQETHQEFLLKGSPFGLQLVQLQELAGYLRERTQPSDQLYYWSEDVQLYYLADRRCPIDMIWSYYVAATGPRERIFAPATKYVIVDTSRPEPDWHWLYPELSKNYNLETVMYGQEIYRRVN
jgi:4-amino-4-deoxy-L-arabinose transferase-like glycosyltransferase